MFHVLPSYHLDSRHHRLPLLLVVGPVRSIFLCTSMERHILHPDVFYHLCLLSAIDFAFDFPVRLLNSHVLFGDSDRWCHLNRARCGRLLPNGFWLGGNLHLSDNCHCVSGHCPCVNQPRLGPLCVLCPWLYYLIVVFNYLLRKLLLQLQQHHQ